MTLPALISPNLLKQNLQPSKKHSQNLKMMISLISDQREKLLRLKISKQTTSKRTLMTLIYVIIDKIKLEMRTNSQQIHTDNITIIWIW